MTIQQRTTAAVRLLAGDKEPVRLASTSNLALAGLLTVDGVVTVAGDRVLAKDQTDATENGIYTASEGTWYRAPDASSSRSLIAGMKVAVQLGTAHGGDVWNLDTNRPDLGDDDIEFSLYLNTTIADDINAARETLVAEMDAIIATGLAAGKATQPEAEAGSSNVGWMTPLRTAQAISYVTNERTFDTRAAAIAAIIPVSVNNIVVLREAAGYRLCRAPYVPGSSSGPRAFQEAGGNWWELDVSAGDINVCWLGARLNGATDDTIAAQDAIDIADAAGGMFVSFPPGNCKITSALTVNGSTTVRGCGETVSAISTSGDHTALIFPDGVGPAVLENIGIYGATSGPPTSILVGVGENALVHMRNCRIWGGGTALLNEGVDGEILNCFIAGCGVGAVEGSLISNGANWYIRCKIDTIGIATTNAYLQGTPISLISVAENHFTQCDFSGPYTNSVKIIDGGTNSALTVFEGCVFSAPININEARWTSFIGCEIGSATFVANGASVSVVGSYGFGAITITGTGTKSLAGNINIS
jgi:hypothetical protein